MKRLFAVILIVGTLIAAGFAWQASVSAMTADMHGHEMGMECLTHCLMAASDEASVSAVAATVLVVAMAAVAWELIVPAFRGESVPAWARFSLDPGRKFLIARLD